MYAHSTTRVALAAALASALCAASAVAAVHVSDTMKGPVARMVPGAYGGIPGGYNETYGYPDHHGALIIEGPMAYKNGPSVWSPTNELGAYGLVVIPGSVVDGACEEVPADSVFAKSRLKPVSLTNGLKDCLIGCNLTEVSATGNDPCKVGSVAAPSSNSPMSCFDVGPGMAGGYGVCGYNCSAFDSTKTDKNTPCPTTGGRPTTDCEIYCDSRTFPVPTS